MSASLVHLDAVCMIKTVLAGTPTQNFSDVVQTAFGVTLHKKRSDVTDENLTSSKESYKSSLTPSEPSSSQKCPLSIDLDSTESKKQKTSLKL